MADTLQLLFEAVRKACSAASWSRGVELVRAGAVIGDREDDDEAVFQITRQGGMISRAVTLFPEDADWECGCASADPACEHVAAAVIAWRRARESGGNLPAPRGGAGRVGYRFERDRGGLALHRVIVVGEESHPLLSTLAAVASGKVAGPRFVAAQADLAAELALGTHRRGLLSRAIVDRLLGRLAHCTDVTLDGKPVQVGREPIGSRVCLDDQEDGFRLFVEDDPSITEVFGNGIVLCADTLRPLAASGLTGRERGELPGGRYFSPDRVSELVTEVLPDLERRLPVEVRTRRLPDTEAIPPRLEIEAHREETLLSVRASLVYGDPVQARVSGGRFVHVAGTVPQRDEQAERRLARRLQRELGLSPGVREEYEGERAVGFAARLERWEGQAPPGALEYFRMAPPLTARLDLRDDGFDLEFDSVAAQARTTHGSADAGSVLRAWQEGSSLVPLNEGGWAPLPGDWLERFGHRLADLLAARDSEGRVPACCVPDLARLCEDLDRPTPPSMQRIRQRVEGFDGIPRAEPPADLSAELRGYQQEGVDWLAFMNDTGMGALLADDMGLGKTLQALCAVRGRTLVVAPTSVLHNWVDEIRRFRPALGVSVYHGARRELDAEADVTLTTYALLRLDAERLSATRWDTVVLDEAQAIKNPDSQVAAAAFGLDAAWRVALTGTPVENRLDELWSQFHFINRGLLGGRRDFQDRYAGPVADGDDEAASRLRERIRPFMLRRMKKEVAPELPPRTEMVLHCVLDDREREIYDAIRAATLEEVVSRLEAGGSVLAALEALLRLRQAACHPSLIPGQEAAGSSKLNVLMEQIDTVAAEGRKALVFSQWTSLLDLTEPHLRAAGIDFVRLDGSTRDRAEVVRRFQDDSGPPVMLISLKAGGTGLNLTAADHIFLLDPWWNPAVEDQAADRAHRIGQDRPVMVYRLVAEETVEEKILDLQQRKRAIADAALSGAAGAAGLTRDDLLDLLG